MNEDEEESKTLRARLELEFCPHYLAGGKGRRQGPESLMQSFTKLSFWKKKVVRKDRMLLLTGAEVLQSFQRQVVVIMRNNWLTLFLFPTKGRQTKVPNPAPALCWLSQLIRLWSRATGSAVKHSHHLCWWEETRPFWPIVLASPVRFLILPFDRKRKKIYLHFVHVFLCAVPVLVFPQKLL